MIGHHDRDGVDIRTGKEFAKVNVGVAALVLLAAGLLGVVLVNPTSLRFPDRGPDRDSSSRGRFDSHPQNGQHLDVVVD